MHFLAHYFTELPNKDPLFVAGLAIPDLAPRFTRAYNSNIVKHTPPTSHALKHIHLGIVQHFGADKRFHHAPPFLKEATLATQSFVDAGLSRERLRLSVIAHIAVEMLIDRQIMLENEGVCDDYYALVDQANEEFIGQYFDLFSLRVEKQIFLRNFQFYKQKRFLLLFTELESIVEGLNKIYGSVTRVEFTADEKRKFLAGLHNIDSRLRYSWQEILNL